MIIESKKEFTANGKALLLISSLFVVVGIIIKNLILVIPGIFLWILVSGTFIMALRQNKFEIELTIRVSKDYVRNRGLVAVALIMKNPTNKSQTLHVILKHSYHFSCIEIPEKLNINIRPRYEIKINWLLLAVQRGNGLIGPIDIELTPLQSIFLNKVTVKLEKNIKILPHRPRINIPWKIKKDLLLKMVNEFAYRMKGEGEEFFSLREYQPGDPLKHIHWYASARYDKLFTKEFEELKHLHFLIFMDLSSTMYGPKFDYALSSLVELSALIQGSQHDLAVIAFSDHVEKFIVPQVGKNELKLMLNLYDLEATANECNLYEAIKFAQRQKLFHSIAIILSDLEGDLRNKLSGLHLLNAMDCRIIFVNFSTMHFNILASKDWIANKVLTIPFQQLLQEVFPSLVRDEYYEREKKLRDVLNSVGGDVVTVKGYEDNLILALYRLMKKYVPTERIVKSFARSGISET